MESEVIAAIITAGVSSFITLIISIYTLISNRKWNQKKIDADLKSKARIDWIQKVRATTAELISLYYKVLNEKDEALAKAYTAAREKSELLILYFGPESTILTGGREVLFNEEDNEGKNKILVDFLSELTKKIDEFYIYEINNGLRKLKKLEKEASDEMSLNPKKVKEEAYFNDEGIKRIARLPIYDEILVNNYYFAKDQVKKYEDIKKSNENELIFLRDVMRNYLKIEWNKAKEGQ